MRGPQAEATASESSGKSSGLFQLGEAGRGGQDGQQPGQEDPALDTSLETAWETVRPTDHSLGRLLGDVAKGHSFSRRVAVGPSGGGVSN